ncbi:YraN family protein [Nocardioides sp. AE5]|uniref:YraN family protein n=1 Tax=Nocardioides sp. AE5 TaxID=2962573 RepID=UPI002882364B|nr:YraN family protein [Nocardioides sp. AE5]MDT0203266.1 YraN family protein [Nocardioides sp. AE5]
MGHRTTDKQRLGAYGETLAARYLVERGMDLLDHNWSCPEGEIDLVLREGRTLVFCEVKTRRSARYGSPFEAVTALKIARMRRLGAAWLTATGTRAPEFRLDMVGIIAPAHGAPQIEHVRGVG